MKTDRDYLRTITERAYTESKVAAEKFPQPNYVALKVAEESGEVIRAVVHCAEGRMEWSELEDEAVQLIAMVFRLLTEGDQINGLIPPDRGK